MIPKQDRHGARTPADLERKYQFEKRYAEAAKLAETVNKNSGDSQQAIEQLSKQYANLSAELGMKLGVDKDGNVVSTINGVATIIKFLANSISIQSDNFKLSENGSVVMGDATIKSTRGEYETPVSTEIKDGTIVLEPDYTINSEGEWISFELLRFKYGSKTYALYMIAVWVENSATNELMLSFGDFVIGELKQE